MTRMARSPGRNHALGYEPVTRLTTFQTKLQYCMGEIDFSNTIQYNVISVFIKRSNVTKDQNDGVFALGNKFPSNVIKTAAKKIVAVVTQYATYDEYLFIEAAGLTLIKINFGITLFKSGYLVAYQYSSLHKVGTLDRISKHIAPGHSKLFISISSKFF